MAAASAASSCQVAWLSVDPVRRKLDFYPRAIAAKIEKAYHDRDPWSPSTCVLGSDFFNATVHFHPSGSCYQTTPGMSMGRAGFKQPGYRSVKRAVKTADNKVVVHSKQVHGEWRIAQNEADSEIKFEENLPPDCMVEGTVDALGEPPHFASRAVLAAAFRLCTLSVPSLQILWRSRLPSTTLSCRCALCRAQERASSSARGMEPILPRVRGTCPWSCGSGAVACRSATAT